MKTYLLRNPITVEPQSARRAPRSTPSASSAPAPAPAPTTATATAGEVRGRPAPMPNAPVLFIGLDVHTDSIAVSLAPSGSPEVHRYGRIGGTHDDARETWLNQRQGPGQA